MWQSIRKCALGFAVLAISSTAALSWGGNGHRTVGMVADLILQSEDPQLYQHIKQILDGHSLSDVSVWADCAKGPRYCSRPLSPDEQAYAKRNKDHHNYHYTDVPIQETEYRAGTAGTESDDVVQVIRYAAKVLGGQSPASGPANLNQKEALWVLVHLVGDIHQPLHVGAVYFDEDCAKPIDPNQDGEGPPKFGIGTVAVATTGGNDLHINKSKSLHSYWDDTTVLGAMRLVGVRDKSIADFGKAIIQSPPANWKTSGDIDTWPQQWATEVLPLAKQAISRVDIGDATSSDDSKSNVKCSWQATLPKDYAAWANTEALNQLGKAGFRLAAMLKAVLANR